MTAAFSFKMMLIFFACLYGCACLEELGDR